MTCSLALSPSTRRRCSLYSSEPTVRTRTAAPAAAAHRQVKKRFGRESSCRARLSTFSANPGGGSRRCRASRKSLSNGFTAFLFQVSRCLFLQQRDTALLMAPYRANRHLERAADLLGIPCLRHNEGSRRSWGSPAAKRRAAGVSPEAKGPFQPDRHGSPAIRRAALHCGSSGAAPRRCSGASWPVAARQ